MYGHPFGRVETKGIAQVVLASELGCQKALFDVALWLKNGMCGFLRDERKAKEILVKLASDGNQDAVEMLMVLEFQNSRESGEK